ncbi:hypothetical protein Syun_014189 [Stephania yunnanensis]|uniref:Uncharacterized protein n=1 Tax=Stephania yunnanensis TaxID=152371 RepID=A0AAP0P9B1_9MAGN
MEDYLQNVKKLRSQMNDAEDLAAKISLEEQTQINGVHAMEKELELAKSEEERLTEVIEKSTKEKDQTRSQNLHNLSRIESLKADCLILCQDWINSNKSCIEAEKLNESTRTFFVSSISARMLHEAHRKARKQGHAKYDNYNDLIAKFKSAKVKFDEIAENKSKLEVEINKMKQTIDQLLSQLDGFPLELKAMDIKSMEEEQKALLSDKAGETEYLQTLRRQIEQLKGISRVVKCTCGEEYTISMETSGLVRLSFLHKLSIVICLTVLHVPYEQKGEKQ